MFIDLFKENLFIVLFLFLFFYEYVQSNGHHLLLIEVYLFTLGPFQESETFVDFREKISFFIGPHM